MRPQRTGVGQDKKSARTVPDKKIHGGAGVRFGPDLAPCAWTARFKKHKRLLKTVRQSLWSRASYFLTEFLPDDVHAMTKLSLISKDWKPGRGKFDYRSDALGAMFLSIKWEGEWRTNAYAPGHAADPHPIHLYNKGTGGVDQTRWTASTRVLVQLAVHGKKS